MVYLTTEVIVTSPVVKSGPWRRNDGLKSLMITTANTRDPLSMTRSLFFDFFLKTLSFSFLRPNTPSLTIGYSVYPVLQTVWLLLEVPFQLDNLSKTQPFFISSQTWSRNESVVDSSRTFSHRTITLSYYSVKDSYLSPVKKGSSFYKHM